VTFLTRFLHGVHFARKRFNLLNQWADNEASGSSVNHPLTILARAVAALFWHSYGPKRGLWQFATVE
jgi:hypothetical protein